MPSNGLITGGTGIARVQPLTSSDEAVASVTEIKKGVYQLANSHYKVQVENGVITSLYDITASREIIPPGGKANQLVIFDDKPLYWQAWDVEVYHLNSRRELPVNKVSILEHGPHRVSLLAETRISEHSWVKTTISLPASSKSSPPGNIEFSADIEWHESMKFLKVEFPVAVRNTSASYETQYGVVQRPTHYNTTWDMAKFEVCCHKWADLSEHGYGVSILNESKYGFATCGNLMRLSLLRAPKAPDAHADMGSHQVRWAMFPHVGGLSSRTVRAAFEFNNPMRVLSHGDPAAVKELLSAIHLVDEHDEVASGSSAAIVIDAIKRGEDDEDVSRADLPARTGRSLVVRMYEALGGRARAKLVWCKDLPVESVCRCNILEDDDDRHGHGGDLSIIESADADADERRAVSIHLRPFEILTLRLQLAR